MKRAISVTRKFGGVPEDYYPLFSWFEETSTWLPEGRNYYIFRHHAEGIFVAERKFGYVITNQSGKEVPTRILCELHVKGELGWIPTAYEMMQFLPTNSWMGFRDRDLTLLLRTHSEDEQTISEKVTQLNLK